MSPEQVKANQHQRAFINHLSKVMAAAQQTIMDKQFLQDAGKSDEWQEGASAMFHTISHMLMPAVAAEVKRIITETIEAVTSRQSAEVIKGLEAVDKAVDDNGVGDAADFLKKFRGTAH
jgi:hypothetical protein